MFSKRSTISSWKRFLAGATTFLGLLAGSAVAAPAAGEYGRRHGLPGFRPHFSNVVDWDNNGTNLVAIGDSTFGAGGGCYRPDNPPSYPDNEGCYQSLDGFPNVVGKLTHRSVYNLYCAGRSSDQILHEQVPLIPDNADIVLIAAGANDDYGTDAAGNSSFIRITRAISECIDMPVLHPRESCEPILREPWEGGLKELPEHLIALIEGVRSKVPNARIVLFGYVNTISKGDVHEVCNFMRPEDINFLRDMMDKLNVVIERVAREQGVGFYIGDRAFDGHRACDPGDDKRVNTFEWGDFYRNLFAINGTPIQIPGWNYNAFHPNAAGYQARGEDFVGTAKVL